MTGVPAGKAIIVGGSLSGLFAGLLLRKHGCRVDIYERSGHELTGRGAGIVTHQPLWDALDDIGIPWRANLGVEVATRRMFGRDGRLLLEVDCPQTMTAWDRMYDLLRQAFSPEHYRLGKELVSIEQDDSQVTATFADGTRVDADPQTLQYAPLSVGFIGGAIAISPSTNAPATGTTYRLVCGTLPKGTRLDSRTGRILGKPTAEISEPVPLRIAETSATGAAAASFLFVVVADGAPQMNYPSHPHVRVGKRVTSGGVTTTLELPSTREEAWRWADIDALRRAAESERAGPVAGADRFLDLPGARLLFVDGVLDESASDLGPVQLTQIDASDHPLGKQALGRGWSLRLERDAALGRPCSARGGGCRCGCRGTGCRRRIFAGRGRIPRWRR